MSSMFGTGVVSGYNPSATSYANAPSGAYFASYQNAGTPGPTGPQGPAGPQGPTGPQGPPGTIPDDIVCNSVTASTIATTQGVNNNSVQLTDAGIGFYENAYQYFSLDNNVPGGNTLRIFTNGVTPGVAMTVGEEGVISMTKDVTVGGQLVVDGPIDVSGVLVGTSASFVGPVQANTANVNNITAATSILYVSAPGGVQVADDLTMTNSAILNVSDIGLVGPDARISLNSCISDPVFTTLQTSLDTNGVPPGGSVSYTLNRSSDTPNNWDSGFYAVNCTLTVGGAGVPYYQGMFSYSPNNVATIFNAYANGFGLVIGADGFGNPILEFFNNTGSTWATPSNLKITKLC